MWPGCPAHSRRTPDKEDDDSSELSDEEDDDTWELSDDCSCEDPDDDPFEDPADSVDSPAAGSSTALSALYANPTSLGKQPISHAKEAPVKNLACTQDCLLFSQEHQNRV